MMKKYSYFCDNCGYICKIKGQALNVTVDVIRYIKDGHIIEQIDDMSADNYTKFTCVICGGTVDEKDIIESEITLEERMKKYGSIKK